MTLISDRGHHRRDRDSGQNSHTHTRTGTDMDMRVLVKYIKQPQKKQNITD